ncbi:esterase-like activity of phytase family protein [Rhodospirillaceae bacterium KN72]|uniref:Esterase-like activity of phytase family protein n=1 Tax=Pacificispira spongiicola TaxID=2729598 RepID=A0A7Y0E379_9PROT|nr:esterase-like activity of phytase family protein [Pacificispira spongiicola]NMM46323.1 esterase-like activity of phytase family protein [Pacificispira spongiicola]
MPFPTVRGARAFALALLGATILSPAGAALADGAFNRIATFPVYETLPDGVDRKTETSAEIISASKDGNTLIFTDSPSNALVFVDASQADAPKSLGRVALGGEPTSVSVAAGVALVGVNTSKSYVEPSGNLSVVTIDGHEIAARCDVKGQPDSVAVSPDGKYVAIAIENERDEDLNDGVIPQMPAGHLAVFDLDGNGMPTNCDAVRIVDMTGLADIAPSDPEPEFVSINADNIAVVTLQENNHIALVDLAAGKVTAHFSAGTSSADAIPTEKARSSDGTGSIKDVPREPDAVAWIDENRFVTANEGDYKGGSRGFTIFDTTGAILFDSGADLEHMAMRHGHYPAKRAHKKGAEPEGVTVGTFGGETYIFVSAERANFAAVYRDTGAAPEFVQFLPTNVGPEGSLALPQRDLFVVANEVDSAEDNVRAAVGLYRFGSDTPAYPTILSDKDPKTGAPIGWGALSGMAADPQSPGKVFAVSDSFYDAARIFTLDVSSSPVHITSYVDLHGGTAKHYDLEGIALRDAGGFWLASEGHPKKELAHLLIQAAADGTVIREIPLPEALTAQAERFSLEGVSEFTVDGKPRVVVAVQREWGDDPKDLTKLGIFDPEAEAWTFVRYPLDAPKDGGWVGLSEITHLDGQRFLVIERDNKGGPDAAIKQLALIDLSTVTPKPFGEDLPTVEKRVIMDLLPAMQSGHGWTPDKVEGLAVTADNRLLAVTDNDGVDDASGETMFLDLGTVDTAGW